jgi:hypothetical protein
MNQSEEYLDGEGDDTGKIPEYYVVFLVHDGHWTVKVDRGTRKVLTRRECFVWVLPA